MNWAARCLVGAVVSEEEQRLERFLAICQSKGVTDKGLAIVEDIISNPPARRVRTRSMGPNTTARFPSRKMGESIQAESGSLEWASVYLKECDSAVSGYWDQPYHKVDLRYRSGKRTARVQSTLDFFVISEDFIGYEECKPVSELEELARKTPGRYRWNQELDRFEIPPLAAYLEGTGLGYRVISDREINSICADNLVHLYDYFSIEPSSEELKYWELCSELLRVKGPIPLPNLQISISGLCRETILKAIAQGSLFINLQSAKLSEPETLLIASNPSDLEGQENSNESDRVRDLVALQGTPREIGEGLKRFKVVEQVIKGEKVASVAEEANISVRTLQRWLGQYREKGMDGLTPEHSKKGNYREKLPALVEEIIQEIIESNYLNSDNQNFPHIYGLILAECRRRDVSPPSKRAVRRRLAIIDDVVSKKVREGAKSAYQYTAYRSVEALQAGKPLTDIYRFLQRCHMDHTQIDLQLVSANGVNLGKPWLTTIVDEHSGFVLSMYLSFRTPSSVSVMSALRLMVKDHEVLPEAIVVDGGKEFQSVYFETLMARYGVSIISREGKPRSGGTVERNFGSLNTVFLDNLTGNNKLAKDIRRLSETHKPENLAIWDPVEFYYALRDYIALFNKESIKAGGLSPTFIRDKSIERFGLSELRRVKFDESFLMHVLLPPKRRGTILRRNSPVQLNRVNYWHVCLKSIPHEGVSVDLRFDPFDLNYIYVFFRKSWLKFQATRPQHRRVDELDGAILAEVARQALYVNERSKVDSRANFASFVEDVNQKAKVRHKEVQHIHKPSKHGDGCSISTSDSEATVESPKCDIWSEIDWDIDVPSSEAGG